MNNMTIEHFLKLCRKVTVTWQKKQGTWPIDVQWKKIEEEEFEFKTATSRENELEEFWDTFFAKLTLLHLKGYWDDDIFSAGIDKLNVITERADKA